MRLLVLAAACALVAAGSATAQTRGLAPTTSSLGAPAMVQTGHTAAMPGPAARPTAMAGTTVARPTTMAHPMVHHGARHHMGRHHGRTHGAAWCMRRAKARHLTGRAMTHAIQRCEAGRHHHRRHGMAHHAMTTTTTHAAAKPAPAKPMTPPKK